jgi:large subunit ribosomal protein L5
VCATLERPGFRVKKRRLMKHKLGRKHKITRQDAIDFMKTKFNVTMEE